MIFDLLVNELNKREHDYTIERKGNERYLEFYLGNELQIFSESFLEMIDKNFEDYITEDLLNW